MAVAALGFTDAPLPAQDAPAKVDLKVLYVGSESGPRTADFVRFLEGHFVEVGTAVYPTFREEQADP